MFLFFFFFAAVLVNAMLDYRKDESFEKQNVARGRGAHGLFRF